MLHEIGHVIAAVAPTLASALFSPAAGLVVHLITESIQSNPTNLLEDLKAGNYGQVLTDLETKYAPLLAPLLSGQKPTNIKLNFEISWPGNTTS